MTFSYNTHNSHFIGHPYISQQEKERALKFRRTISKSTTTILYYTCIVYDTYSRENNIIKKRDFRERKRRERI